MAGSQTVPVLNRESVKVVTVKKGDKVRFQGVNDVQEVVSVNGPTFPFCKDGPQDMTVWVQTKNGDFPMADIVSE